MANILTVYYSQKVQNYWNGSIKNIPKGNKRMAEFIQNTVGGNVYGIGFVSEHVKLF